tara:strand:+ start:921 stop:1127 length:207 start_codon:yes stop_codon:yes gene_type:complete
MLKDKELIISIYRNMLFYYIQNVGKKSKITGATITPKMISLITERIFELGGTIPSETYEVCWEEITKV